MLTPLACCSAFEETLKALASASSAVIVLKDFQPDDIRKGNVHDAFEIAKQKIKDCFTKFNVVLY